jgi:hypothetical protein
MTDLVAILEGVEERKLRTGRSAITTGRVTIMWVIQTQRGLGKILGVSHVAVGKAERDGRIQRLPDGAFDVITCLDCWRDNTYPALYRHEGRPWLDTDRPLEGRVLAALLRRIEASGAEWVPDEG